MLRGCRISCAMRGFTRLLSLSAVKICLEQAFGNEYRKTSVVTPKELMPPEAAVEQMITVDEANYRREVRRWAACLCDLVKGVTKGELFGTGEGGWCCLTRAGVER